MLSKNIIPQDDISNNLNSVFDRLFKKMFPNLTIEKLNYLLTNSVLSEEYQDEYTKQQEYLEYYLTITDAFNKYSEDTKSDLSVG